MTDARIILWFTWFVASNYLKNVALLAKERWLAGREESILPNQNRNTLCFLEAGKDVSLLRHFKGENPSGASGAGL
ncbi:MAG TPA: hypothetical protein VMJ13_11635 [Candidatus Acidoferrum sp.]|nr:hypothetical protein [Candidatus Acidoferrum sp.]